MPRHEAIPQVAELNYDTDADGNDAMRWEREGSEANTDDGEIGRPFVKEIELSNGEVISLPSLKVSEVSVYHGSPVRGIKVFDVDEGDQWTIGKGIYFAPLKETAIQYANTRGNGIPGVVYEAKIRGIELADLRDLSGQVEFSKLLRQDVIAWAERALSDLPDETLLKDALEGAVNEVIATIDDRAWDRINLRNITANYGPIVTDLLQKHGYGGLVGWEGEYNAVDDHDSIVIFDASDIEIVREAEL